MVNTFNKPVIPANEEQRLKALDYYDILNDLPDRYFNNLAHIIGATFNAKIALVSLVGRDTVHFKGNYGMSALNSEDRGQSLCSLAILDDEPTVFHDSLKEPCLLSNPLVVGSFGLRFYAGAPITTKEGYNIGTVCVVGKEPRDFSQQEKDLLVLFAKNAMIEIELRREIRQQRQHAEM